MKEILQHRSVKEIEIAEAVFDDIRISSEQALYLYENSDPVFCGWLANILKERNYNQRVFYNKNIHVEVSNICINRCSFCSFYRDRLDSPAWEMSIDDIMVLIAEKSTDGITEIHITGGLHPEKKLAFYVELLTQIRAKYPEVHIKAFTAVEIEYFAKTENRSYQDVLGILKSCGMNSLAGGGAEILDDNIREILCPLKTKSQTWLEIHRIAHEMGIKSNCTILYGHIEKYKDRVYHMRKLRELQDRTGGFNCFIPLKYKSHGNSLEINTETSLSEELKNYAISRLFLDNIPHIKAYWPMSGVEMALMALSFGADDFDGTISDSTKIYSMAGGEKKPELSENQIRNLLSEAGFIAFERNSEYVVIAENEIY
ncbi:MAG TPA: aminofutalosine synthase MqnE [Bacteroidales bacterium]|nr:aminofutalosine synthase MqnE [Bacteroidales bacterium]